MAKTNSSRPPQRSFALWLAANAIATFIPVHILLLFVSLFGYSGLTGLAFALLISGPAIAIAWLIISTTIIYYRLGKNKSIRPRDRSLILWVQTNLVAILIIFPSLFRYGELVRLAFSLQALGLVIAIAWIIISMGIIFYRFGRNPLPAQQSQHKD